MAVVVVVAVEEAAQLISVQRIVCGIQIQNDLFRGLGLEPQEQVHQKTVDLVGAAGQFDGEMALMVIQNTTAEIDHHGFELLPRAPGQTQLEQGQLALDVIIAGHVEGDITAMGKVEIMDTARITGTVTGEAIAVAEGAIVEGVMKTTGQSEPTAFVEKRKTEY